jgi:Heme/copper-type cytochrome/quinol oxidase, subunit 3
MRAATPNAADNPAHTADEGEEGNLLLWILVWSELAVFGILIAGFIVMSWLHMETFAAARLQLGTRLAGLNTVILLASGWQAALAATAATKRTRRIFLLIAAGLGLVFAVLKMVEYAGEWEQAADPAFASFYELYFLLTGFHLAHVVFVALLMFAAAVKAERRNVVALATVWHVIDLVWLVMFPVIYLS